MLSHPQDNSRPDSYQSDNARNDKRSDIFFREASQVATPTRTILDRNRSSVFDNDPVDYRKNYRENRHSSDIFFSGNQPTKFGNYEPSVSAQKRTPIKQQETQNYVHNELSREHQLEQDAANMAYEQETDRLIQQHQQEMQQDKSEYESTPERHEEHRHELPRHEAQEAYRKNVISSVFNMDSEESFRPARRYYGYSAPTDIFNQKSIQELERKPMRESREKEIPRENTFVPSVRQFRNQTSFSQLFGDCPEIDRQVRASEPRRTKEKRLSNVEKLQRTCGLSSDDSNRSTRGKARGAGTGLGSQIWF